MAGCPEAKSSDNPNLLGQLSLEDGLEYYLDWRHQYLDYGLWPNLDYLDCQLAELVLGRLPNLEIVDCIGIFAKQLLDIFEDQAAENDRDQTVGAAGFKGSRRCQIGH